MLRYRVSAMAPDPALIARAAEVVRAGGIVALPTETSYGLAVDPFNARAVSNVFAGKQRPLDRAIPLIAASEAQVTEQIGVLPPRALKLARRFWPGPLTVLLVAPPELAAVASGTGLVGIRVPGHDVPRALCLACARVLTATSANLSGQPSLDDPDLVVASLHGVVNLLIDGGPTTGGLPSTVVDVTGPAPQLIRAGAVPWEEVVRCLEER
jgi:L-threonylcarbamoyladenylate synthase